MDRLYLDNFYNIKDDARFSNNIWESLEEENISQVVDIFNEALKGVPYDDYKDRDESWYRSLFLMLLSGARITYFAEVHTFQGRSDVVISFKDKLIVVIEFKFAKNSRGVSYQLIYNVIEYSIEKDSGNDWKFDLYKRRFLGMLFLFLNKAYYLYYSCIF